MLVLALAAALLPDDRGRRLGAAGLLLLALALAAWRAGSPPETGLMPPARLGRGFLVGNSGLLLLGAALLGFAVPRTPPAPLRPWAMALTVIGLVALGPVPAAFFAAAGPARALAAAAAFGLIGAAVVIAVRGMAAGRAGRTARRFMPPPLSPALGPASGVRRLAVVLTVAAAAALTALGPHLALVFAGVVVVAWAGYLGAHPAGARPVPVAPLLTLLLVPAYWLLATIAGPLGLGMSALRELPLSPAAELVLAPLLLLAGWGTTGLWPLQRQLPGALAAPAGALLLIRVAAPLVPAGLTYWRPLAVPLLMLGLWHAAAWSRWPLVVAAAGFLGVAGAPAQAVAPVAGLLAMGPALELSSMSTLHARVTPLLRPAAWPLIAAAGVALLAELLRGEVVYSAIGVLGAAVLVAAGAASSSEAAARAR